MGRPKVTFNYGQIFGIWKYIRETDSYVSPTKRPNGKDKITRCHVISCTNCNHETIREQSKLSEDSHGCFHCRGLPQGQTGLNALFARYIESVVKRNGKMLFTIEQFKHMTSQNCHYCNSAPNKVSFTTEWGSYPYNGIDRIDNSIVDYNPENCVPCCYTCNIAKSDRTYQEFKEHIARLIKFQLNKRKVNQ